MTFAIADCLSQFLRFFSQTQMWDPFPYSLVALATLYVTGAEIFGRRKFAADEFLAKIIENIDFFRGKICLSTILCPKILCVASHYWLGNRIKSISCIQSLAEIFVFFHNFLWPKIFHQKIDFSNKFLHYLKYSALTMPLSDTCHLNFWVMFELSLRR